MSPSFHASIFFCKQNRKAKAKAKAEGRSRAEGVWAALVRSKGHVRSTRAIANLSLEPCLCCVRCRLKLSIMSVSHLLVLRSVFGAQSSAGSLLVLRARPGFLSALQQNSAREGNKKGGQMSEPQSQEPNTLFLFASVSWMLILNIDDDFSYSPALVGKSAFYGAPRFFASKNIYYLSSFRLSPPSMCPTCSPPLSPLHPLHLPGAQRQAGRDQVG